MLTLVDMWQPDIREYLNASKQRLQGGAIQRTIDRLWQVLVEIFSLPDPPTNPRFEYLRHLASQMRGQTVVTLNYDDALEHMAYSTTFRIDSDPFPQPLSGTVARLNAPLRLVKLHGSLNWSRDNISGDVEALPPMQSFRHSQEPWTGHTPGIIFGAGNKLRPDGPFLALYQQFLEALAAAQQVVIIGYSFRDAHVNEAIRRWILYQASEDGLLRVGDVGDDLQPIVKSWIDQRSLDVEYIRGPAEETMKELIAPRPQLLKPKRPSTNSSQ